MQIIIASIYYLKILFENKKEFLKTVSRCSATLYNQQNSLTIK